MVTCKRCLKISKTIVRVQEFIKELMPIALGARVGLSLVHFT